MRSSSSILRSRPLQHRTARLIAGLDVLHADDRRRQPLDRRREDERVDRLVGDGGDRLELRQRLQPRLRLPRLRRLEAEAVDELLHVLALLLLLPAELDLQRLPFAPLAVEGIVGAAIEDELAVLEMHDRIDGAVEEVAVVADEEHAPRIGGDVALEPERALEVEIVGRLVEEEEVGLGEEHGGERDPHAPAAGEGRARPLLRRLVEAEAGQDPAPPAPRRHGRRCRRGACGSRRCGGRRGRSPPRRGGWRVRGRRRAPPRSGFPDRPAPPARPRRSASCAARRSSPISGSSAPMISRNRVDLPAPFRPTRPVLAPSASATVAWSMSTRSPIR